MYVKAGFFEFEDENEQVRGSERGATPATLSIPTQSPAQPSLLVKWLIRFQ